MIPTNAVLNQLQNLLNTDTTQLAAAAVKHVHLYKTNFTPSPTLAYDATKEADFGGYAALNAPIGNQLAFNDPVTQELIVQLKDPAGGWHWQASSGLNLPQTIYGFVLTDSTDTDTYGSQKFDTPVTLTNSGDGVDIGVIRFSFVPPVLE